MIKFVYNKENARCTWCKRTKNPHSDFDEPIPTKVFLSKKMRKIELCLSCYEIEMEMSYEANEDFYKFLDDRFEKLLMLENIRRFR